jgi:hypothetical protein
MNAIFHQLLAKKTPEQCPEFKLVPHQTDQPIDENQSVVHYPKEEDKDGFQKVVDLAVSLMNSPQSIQGIFEQKCIAQVLFNKLDYFTFITLELTTYPFGKTFMEEIKERRGAKYEIATTTKNHLIIWLLCARQYLLKSILPLIATQKAKYNDTCELGIGLYEVLDEDLHDVSIRNYAMYDYLDQFFDTFADSPDLYNLREPYIRSFDQWIMRSFMSSVLKYEDFYWEKYEGQELYLRIYVWYLMVNVLLSFHPHVLNALALVTIVEHDAEKMWKVLDVITTAYVYYRDGRFTRNNFLTNHDIYADKGYIPGYRSRILEDTGILPKDFMFGFMWKLDKDLTEEIMNNVPKLKDRLAEVKDKYTSSSHKYLGNNVFTDVASGIMSITQQSFRDTWLNQLSGRSTHFGT